MKEYEMGKHAYKTVPLYFHLAEKQQIDIEKISFSELPVVDKSSYVNSGISMISSKYISDYMNQRLRYTRTSGSTGKFSEVYWNQEDYNRSLASLWIWRKKYYQIHPGNRLAYFFPANQGEQGYSVIGHALALSRRYFSDGNLEEAYEKILEFQPQWMILQPSLALLLSNLAEKKSRIPESLRYIEFTGEFLEERIRQQVEKVFGCATANQYGTKEVNSIAYECPEGTLHLMQDNVYLETIGETEDEGELCVTSLNNYAMPFVRFNLEDRGRILRSKICACGRCTDALELFAGRMNEWICCKNGTKIHSYTLVQIIHQANDEMDGLIIQYQIVQREFDYFDIRLVLEEEESFLEIAALLKSRFREKMGDEIQIEIHLSNVLLPSAKTGKLADFISEVGKN